MQPTDFASGQPDNITAACQASLSSRLQAEMAHWAVTEIPTKGTESTRLRLANLNSFKLPRLKKDFQALHVEAHVIRRFRILSKMETSVVSWGTFLPQELEIDVIWTPSLFFLKKKGLFSMPQGET